jgi:hypothetical protein
LWLPCARSSDVATADRVAASRLKQKSRFRGRFGEAAVVEPSGRVGPASAATAGGDLDVASPKVRQVVAELPSSAELIARRRDEVMLEGMMNRHNSIHEAMEIPQAQGFRASAIRTAVWSAWSRGVG